MKIHEQIKQARKASNLTQVALAERLGVTQQCIQQAEAKGVISLYLLSKIAQELKVEFIVK